LSGVEFILGVFASILAAFIWDRFISKIPTFDRFGSANIQGIWIGKISYDYRKERQGYNVIKIRKIKGNVRAYMEHYSMDLDGITRIVGIKGFGIFNAPTLSIAYQFDRKYINQSGVLIARMQSIGMVGDVLKANFSQFVENDDEKTNSIKLISEDYTLYRTNIPVLSQLRVLIGKHYFSSFNKMVKHYEQAMLKNGIKKKYSQ